MQDASKKILKTIIICLVSLIFILGIAVLVVVLNFKKPDILATDSIISPTEGGKLLGKTTVKIQNDNGYSLRVDSLCYIMTINGKTYLAGRKDSQIVLKAHAASDFSLPYVVEAKAMDEDFKGQESAINHFVIDAYISVWGIKKLHIHFPVDKKITFLKKPVLIADHNYIKIDDNGNAKINLVLKLVNPNKYPLEVDSPALTLSLNGQKYLDGGKYKKVSLGPLDTQKVQLPLVFKLKKFMTEFKGKDSALADVNFEFLLSAADIKNEHITLKFKKEVPLIVDFDVAVEEVKINKLGFNNCDLTAYVTVGNPNPVTVNFDHLHYVLKVDGLPWADGLYTKSTTLKKKSTVNLAIPIHLDTKKISKSAGDYLKGDKIQNYEIQAEFNIKVPDPNLKNIKMEAKKSGVLHLGKLLGKKKEK